MADLELRDLTKVYRGGFQAVRGLSMSATDGEFIVLVGPSGCGKSTTLRMIAGLEAVTAGDVCIDGRSVIDVPTSDRDVAMVLQDAALYPHMTAAANIGFGLRNRRVDAAEVEARTQEIAAMLGIVGVLDRRPETLSGGQRQRVALARALVRRPAVCLLDEPLSDLEASLRHQLRSEIRATQRRLGITTISVTHDQEEAMTMSDRLVVMSDGIVQQIGTPLDVYRRPANRFVATFIGSPPMNLIAGRVDERAGGRIFVEDGDGWVVPLDDSSIDLGPAVLGVRPHDLHVTNGSALSVSIDAVEHLGDAVDVRGTTAADQPVCIRCSTDASPSPGDSIGVTIGGSGVHLFAPDGAGRRLN